MRVKFNQAVHLTGPDGKKGKDYSRGIHEVPAEHLQHPFFHKLIKAGMAVDAEAMPIVSNLTIQERQKMLAERLAPKSTAIVQAEPEAAEESVPAESEGASGDEEMKDQSFKKKHKKQR